MAHPETGAVFFMRTARYGLPVNQTSGTNVACSKDARPKCHAVPAERSPHSGRSRSAARLKGAEIIKSE